MESSESILSLLVVCTGCKLAKPRGEFYLKSVAPKRPTKGLTHPFRARCKACEIARQADIKAKTPPAKWMFDRVRHRAKAEGKEFTISISDIFIPTHCPILGIELAPVGAAQTVATPTLDRIDSSRGYISGNIAVISARANKLKGEGTAAQHDRIAAWMRSKGVD